MISKSEILATIGRWAKHYNQDKVSGLSIGIKFNQLQRYLWLVGSYDIDLLDLMVDVDGTLARVTKNGHKFYLAV